MGKQNSLVLLVTAILIAFVTGAHHETKDLGAAVGALFSGFGNSQESTRPEDNTLTTGELIDHEDMMGESSDDFDHGNLRTMDQDHMMEDSSDDLNQGHLGATDHDGHLNNAHIKSRPKISWSGINQSKMHSSSHIEHDISNSDIEHDITNSHIEHHITNSQIEHDDITNVSVDMDPVSHANTRPCNCPKSCGCQYKHKNSHNGNDAKHHNTRKSTGKHKNLKYGDTEGKSYKTGAGKYKHSLPYNKVDIKSKDFQTGAGKYNHKKHSGDAAEYKDYPIRAGKFNHKNFNEGEYKDYRAGAGKYNQMINNGDTVNREYQTGADKYNQENHKGDVEYNHYQTAPVKYNHRNFKRGDVEYKDYHTGNDKYNRKNYKGGEPAYKDSHYHQIVPTEY